MALYPLIGTRDGAIGNIADAGPFEVYIGIETNATKVGVSWY